MNQEINALQTKPLEPTEHYLSIAWGLILSLLSCGLYNIYWNYRQFHTLNTLLGRYEYDFAKWLALSLVTCGLYHVYYEWKMGGDLAEALRSHGYREPSAFQLTALVLSLLGLTVIADAIFQNEINRLCSSASPAGLPPAGAGNRR